MDFTKAIKANRRALLDDVFLRAELLIAPFQQTLDTFLAELFQAQLPADWRQRFRNFFATYPTDDLTIDEQSIADLEIWVEAWGRFCELLPEAETAPEAVDVTVAVENVIEVEPPKPVPVEVPDSKPFVRAKSRDYGRVQITPGDRFFLDKLTEAEQCIEMMRQALEVLGAKLDRAVVKEIVVVEDDVATIERLIWNYNDAIESARETWLREDLSWYRLDQLERIATPQFLRLPSFVDDDQYERSKTQGFRILERFEGRDVTMARVELTGKVLEGAGFAASIFSGGFVIREVAKKGGKIAVAKFLAVGAAGVAVEQVAEASANALGVSEHTIRGVALAASLVSLVILRRKFGATGQQQLRNKSIPSTPRNDSTGALESAKAPPVNRPSNSPGKNARRRITGVERGASDVNSEPTAASDAGSLESRPGSVSGNPSNRLIETGIPRKDGRGWVRRWTDMTAEEELAQARAIYERYKELEAEASRLPPDQVKEYVFEQMKKFRTQYRSDFLKGRGR